MLLVLVTTSSLQAPLNKLRSFIWLSLEIESSLKIFASKKHARHTETWSYDRASLSSAVRIFRLKPCIYTLCFPESEAMRSSQMAFSKCARHKCERQPGLMRDVSQVLARSSSEVCQNPPVLPYIYQPAEIMLVFPTTL